MLLHQDGLAFRASGAGFDRHARRRHGGDLFGLPDEEESTASTFRALKGVFSRHGLPMSLYTDRCARYFHTTKAGEIDREQPTQVGRALARLGVEHIGAYSPQARGRSERAFLTLQDRLVKELAWRGSRRSRPPTRSSARCV
jgi:hypothetical protein